MQNGSPLNARILVVDDEAHIVQVVALKFRNAGLEVETAGDGDEALALVRRTPFDLVVTDLQMPTDAFSSALRRASQRWAQLVGQLRIAAMSGASAATDQKINAEQKVVREPDSAALLAFVRSVILSRQKRSDFLDATLFSDPAWDILLDLTSAKLDGKAVPVSSACAAAHVPFSTAFRHVGHLVESGLVKRWKDPSDRRRDLLELEDETMAAMTRYLATIMQREGSGLA